MELTPLSRTAYNQKAKQNAEIIEQQLGNYLSHRELGKKNPILDFLFEYYSFRPALLQRYSPGINTTLLFDPHETESETNAFPFPDYYQRIPQQSTWEMNPHLFPEHRIEALHWVITLLEKTQQREPRFNCLGLHEWAMVYHQETHKRHTLPLRLSVEETRSLVESRPVVCSHYDAFRFFTPEARPLNQVEVSKVLRPEREQTGCIHVNMDIYRWSYTYYPWVSSALITDAFLLAKEAREIDMRASPYNVEIIGLKPICIETKDGAEEYVVYQKELSVKGKLLRQRLIDELWILYNKRTNENHAHLELV